MPYARPPHPVNSSTACTSRSWSCLVIWLLFEPESAHHMVSEISENRNILSYASYPLRSASKSKRDQLRLPIGGIGGNAPMGGTGGIGGIGGIGAISANGIIGPPLAPF